MEMLHSVCEGLDVHKKTFGTTTEELNELFDWLVTFDCSSVVMESTGARERSPERG